MDGQSRLPAIRKRGEGLEGYSLCSNKNGIRPTRVQGGTNFSSPKPRMSLCLRGFVPLRLRGTPSRMKEDRKVRGLVSAVIFVPASKKKVISRLSLSRDLPKYMHSPAQNSPWKSRVVPANRNSILILRTS